MQNPREADAARHSNDIAAVPTAKQKSHFKSGLFAGIYGRGKRIRTSGPCVPNAVLYQAELFPDTFFYYSFYPAKP